MINTENREHLIRTLEEKLGCSLSTLAELLREEVNSEFKQVQEPYKAVTKLMQDIGIPANLFGFNYIREGIILSLTILNGPNALTSPRTCIRPLPKHLTLLPTESNVPFATQSKLPWKGVILIFWKKCLVLRFPLVR